MLLLLGIGLPILLLAAKTIQSAVAATRGKSSAPQKLEEAVKLDPANPELHYRLGLAYCSALEDTSHAKGLQQLRQATKLNPRQPVYWSGLAAACQSFGQNTCADQAIERALALGPMMPRFHWEAANLDLLEGRPDQALAQFHRLLYLDPSYAREAFRLSLASLDNPEKVYQKVIAGDQNPSLSFAYINFLTAFDRGSAALAVWQDILSQNEPFSFSLAAPYLEWLLGQGSSDEALAVWHDMEQRGIVKDVGAEVPGNRVFNGSFEQSPLNAGLDWRIQDGLYYRVDPGDPGAYQGKRCLRVDFTVSENEECEPAYEVVPVTPNQAYLLQAYVRSDSISSDTGPRLRVLDPQCASCLDASTAGTTGTTPWHRVSLSFTTGPTTRWVQLSLWRPRSRAFPTEISGTFWLDAVTLEAAPSGDKMARATSSRKP